MNKILRFFFGLVIVFLLQISYVLAQTQYNWRYQSSADCTALTTGKFADLCYDTTDSTLWKCVPTGGADTTCDSVGEWEQAGGSSGPASQWGDGVDSSIYYVSGNVGIGEDIPTAPLVVVPPVTYSWGSGGDVEYSYNAGAGVYYRVHVWNTVGTFNFTAPQGVGVGTTMQVLVLAGGGSGSSGYGACGTYPPGGGAGGVIQNNTFAYTGGATLTVTVGEGGTYSQDSGGNSVFGSLTSIGGGTGCTVGGSGGGGAAGTSGQGNAGGTGPHGTDGGGGGCGGAGSGLNGGTACTSTILGTSPFTFAGGGAGGGDQQAGTGGSGIGGTWSYTPAPNTGSGGGAPYWTGGGGYFNGGTSGSSGRVVVRYTIPALTYGSAQAVNIAGNLSIGKNTPATARVDIVGQGNSNATSSVNIKNLDNLSILEVKDNGNIGVGTTSPSSILTVSGSSGVTIIGTGSVSGYTPDYPPAHSSTYVLATTSYSGQYYPYFATNPALSVTGGAANNSWVSANGYYTNQRFNIDLGSEKLITRVHYQGWHDNGSYGDTAPKDFTFWGSNTAGSFADTAYATDTGWTQITTDISQMVQNDCGNVSCPKYIYASDNHTSYRYYSFKFANNWRGSSYIGLRRIELQEAVYSPMPSQIYKSTTAQLGKVYVDGSDSNKFKIDVPLTTRMVIDVNGNVGIGTTLSLNKLDVSGGVAIGTTYAGTFIAPTNGMLIAGNVGIGTAIPRSNLEVAGTVNIGIGTSYTNFEIDGTLYMGGNATVFEDMWVVLNSATAVNAPAIETRFGSRLYVFSDEAVNEDQLPFVTQLPHSYKQGSNIIPHLHYAGEDGTACNYKFGLDYRWTNYNVGVGTTNVSIGTTSANSTTVDLHNMAPFAALDGTGKTISSVITGTLFRNSTSVDDTCNGKNASVLQFDLHYEQDTIGSRQSTSK